MARLRVYDISDGFLAIQLMDVLRLLAPRSLQATWVISSVKSSKPGLEWFEATGEGGEQLEALAANNACLSGSDLACLAENTRQVIWGEFTARNSEQPGNPWVIIRAVDSTFYEIETDDETVLTTITSSYKDIRIGEPPVMSWVFDRAFE
ncbi:hypothetical protein [Rhizobium paknamense]|uniref:Uncharacterized protein n=1 Tax=Rhizobium paknamense TaxID=1206817 RepID=A0ABU0IC56_9HYPH|nr:hypothetical protein [Rhizobium paknamense]MDQ0455045.1 hypothetical protein [Rhizobium paknamense]